jgi:steroid delta-isomerase-like uncharacterized protein
VDDDTVPTKGGNDMTMVDSHNIAQKFVDFVTEGQLDDPSIFSPDFVYHNPNGVEFDLASSAETVKAFFAAIPDHKTTIEDQLSDGDKFAYRWTTRGHQLGVMQGLPPTGKEVAIIGVTIIRLADDKIAEVWDYVDLLGLLQQLGAIPQAG